MVTDDTGGTIMSLTKIVKMKKLKKKHLLRGLQNIQSRYYCEFSEKEHLIISSVIARLGKQKPKSKWIKKGGEILKQAAVIFRNMF